MYKIYLFVGGDVLEEEWNYNIVDVFVVVGVKYYEYYYGESIWC